MAESINPQYGFFDHAPRFVAFAEHEKELNEKFELLLSASEPQTLEVTDPEHHLLLSAEEISRLWGLFPASARARAMPNSPVIKSGTPRWFAHKPLSELGHPVTTGKEEEALSPTAHCLAHTETKTGIITMHEIPENGFSDTVKRLIQAGVAVHELAHTIVNTELWSQDQEYQLALSTGEIVPILDWFAMFAYAAEQHPPISRYAAAYRNEDGRFPREGNALALGTEVVEEVVESITAELLGFAVSPNGLTFEPFKDREELQKSVRAYLNASPPSPDT